MNEKVEKAIRELGYVPNPNGEAERTSSRIPALSAIRFAREPSEIFGNPYYSNVLLVYPMRPKNTDTTCKFPPFALSISKSRNA